MIDVTRGDRVLVRDVLKGREWHASVMAAGADVIITEDDARFIERFDADGWSPSRTRRIIGKSK